MTSPPSPAAAPPVADGLVLAIDTGSPLTSVALARDDGTLALESAERASTADSVLAMIDAVFARAGAAPRDLGSVAVLRGPGSFTGLRIGLATALGLHQALGVRVAPMPTLRVLAEAAHAAPGENIERIVAVVDALRGGWFAQSFARSAAGEALDEEGPPRIAAAAALRDLGPARWIGFGIERLAETGALDRPLLIEPGPLAPVAARMARSWTVWNPALLTEPLYLRPAPTTPPRRS